MMKKLITLSFFCLLFAGYSFGQSESKSYFTSGGEMIFSFANIEDNGHKESSVLRWAPVFNVQSMWNSDINEHFGVFTGLAVRNVGFIYDNYSATRMNGETAVGTYKKKFRTYNVGIPVGFKIGNLNKMFLYAGYEIEFPFLYKEKTFDGDDKIDKITGWFSDRNEWFQHGLLVGVQFPYGLNLKFKYYFSELLNQDYAESNGNKPYAGLKANVFYFSLSSSLFKNFDFEKPSPEKVY
jgi:hypothetical protein